MPHVSNPLKLLNDFLKINGLVSSGNDLNQKQIVGVA